MNRASGPPSKATATTLCQKCLKRGHYSFECTAPAQSRPYAARPSRTEQFKNPKLAPKLLSDTPNELMKKKGIADEQLAKSAKDREEKRGREKQSSGGSESRSNSSASVSTISTNKSRSPSPPPKSKSKRARDRSLKHDSQKKRYRRSESPPQDDDSAEDGATRADGRSRQRKRKSSRSPDRKKTAKRRDSSGSPRGRKDGARGRRGVRDDRSRSPSREPKPDGHQRNVLERRSLRERSLSPFSKRLALTQEVNQGRR